MSNDEAIVQLLTEIRDNQRQQLEAHQKSQRDYIEFYKAALAKQQRRAIIAAVVVGLGIFLLTLSLISK